MSDGTHPASLELCILCSAFALSCQQILISHPSLGAFGDGEKSAQGWGTLMTFLASGPAPTAVPSSMWQVPWQQGQMVFALLGLIHGRD